MYVTPTHALANQLRAATYLTKDKNLIDLLKEAAERLEDLEKIAEHYRLKAEDAAKLLQPCQEVSRNDTEEKPRVLSEEEKLQVLENLKPTLQNIVYAITPALRDMCELLKDRDRVKAVSDSLKEKIAENYRLKAEEVAGK